MRVLLKLPLSVYSGYGNDGIGLAQALVLAGCDVYLQPTFVSPPLPASIAHLLTKPLVAPFDLAIVHVDPAALQISPEMRRSCSTVVGWTMWEFTTLDNLGMRRKLGKQLVHLDALIAYDEVTAGAFRNWYPRVPTVIQQGGYWPDYWAPMVRDFHDPDEFVFAMVGALHSRKDPWTAINAFNELKHEYPAEFDCAQLHLKTSVPGLHPKMAEWIPKLRIHYDSWPVEVLRAFYSRVHVLVSTSHGEGKNMPALEIMSTGAPVIATDFGGHRQWLHPDYAYPLRCQVKAFDPRYPDCHHACADVEHLKELMLGCVRNRAEVQRKGTLASQVIPTRCSWPVVLDRAVASLESVVPRGAELRVLYEAAGAAATRSGVGLREAV